MIHQTIKISEIPTLETKQVWSVFTKSYDEYRKSPFTPKGEKFYDKFRTAKQELKNRNEGWWGL